MALVTGAEVLALAGTPRPTDDQIAWADQSANAINAAVLQYLGEYLYVYPGAVPRSARRPEYRPRAPRAEVDWPAVLDFDVGSPGYEEVKPAAELAALELYKRREAPFGSTSYADAYGQAIRLSRDYLGPIMPTLRRWHPTAGVVAS